MHCLVLIIFYGDEYYSQHFEAIILSWNVVPILQLNYCYFQNHFVNISR